MPPPIPHVWSPPPLPRRTPHPTTHKRQNPNPSLALKVASKGTAFTIYTICVEYTNEKKKKKSVIYITH